MPDKLTNSSKDYNNILCVCVTVCVCVCVCVSGDPDNMYIVVCVICNCFRCKILDEAILRFGNGILYH